MGRASLLRRSPALVVAVAAVVVAFAGIAVASIPDGSGVIHGCYTKTSGALRVIDTAIATQKCTSAQLPLTWSQKGPTGPTGPTGPNGTNGTNGATGPAGVSGYQVVQSPPFSNPAGTQTGGVVNCPIGKVPTGGGVVGGGISHNVNSSNPTSNGWQAYMNNSGTGTQTFTVFVICANAS
jgi:hypothetical protein